MRTFKTWLPLALVMGLLMGGMVFGPPLAERIAYAAEKGKQEATRAELAELSERDHLSTLFRAVAKAVKPAVVEVRVEKLAKLPDVEKFLEPFENDFPFRFRFRFPKRQRQPRKLRGLGSGVIVDAENGYVLTNYHVVGDADEVEVVLGDGRKFEAQWVRSDPDTDLAVIKIGADGLVEAPLGDSDAMRVGDWVLAIGAPRGLSQTVTAGIISAKDRYQYQRFSHTSYQNFLQTDAAINKGNSGGPLVNMKGEVIGINNFIASYSGGNEGIGFAIPSNMVRDVMDQLIDRGKVVRGYLGVMIQDLGPRAVKSLGLPDSRGALVTLVEEGKPADEAGIRIGDVIVSVNGKAVANVNELRNAVAGIRPGKIVEVGIYRDGEKMTVELTLIARPAGRAFARRGEEAPGETGVRGLGIHVVTATEELAKKYGYKKPVKGVLITEVGEDSDAFDQGLRGGMVITHVQDKPVESAGEFAEAVEGADPGLGLRLRVINPLGGAKYVFLRAGKS